MYFRKKKRTSKILAIVYFMSVAILPATVENTRGLVAPIIAKKPAKLAVTPLISKSFREVSEDIQKAKDIEEQVKKKEQAAVLSRGGSGLEENVVQVLEGFEVTWYNNDGISYTTKSGATTIAGRTVSVDPKLIPLGTWIEICMPDGSVLKRKAEDTGGAVHGRILDVYDSRSASELKQRGRTKHVMVRILKGE